MPTTQRFFLDTEFLEDGQTIDLVSIALVTEDGRSFYAQSRDFNPAKANPWVRTHVFPHLTAWKEQSLWMTRAEIAHALRVFVSHGVSSPPSIEFWGYYSAYDWVVLCQLFGTMMDLPQGWPMYCHDLRQALDARGWEEIRQPETMPHHALSDAQWIYETWYTYVWDAEHDAA